MRIVAILVLVFGVALAGGAIFFASKYYDELQASMVRPEGPKTVRVLVAKEALKYGAIVKPDNLQWVEWPAGAVPPGAYTSVEELLGEKGDQRRIVMRTIEPGEPILQGKISKFGESDRMAMNLGAGMRAVSFSINAVSGVSGFVAAGDHVDILLTRTLEGSLISSVVLQDITIIAVDQRTNYEARGPRLGSTVTVEVDTRQAQILALAKRLGELSLTLRGFGEAVGEDLKPVTADELSDFQKPEEAPVKKVRVRRAGTVKHVIIGAETEAIAEPTEEPADEAAPAN